METSEDNINIYKFDLSDNFPISILRNFLNPQISDGRFRMHYHNCIEIVLCEKGKGCVDFIGSTESIEEGDVCFIGSEVMHMVYSETGNKFICTYLMVDVKKMLDSIIPLNQLEDAADIKEMSTDYHICLKKGNVDDIEPLVQVIVKRMIEHPINYECSVKGLLLDVMMEFFREYNKNLGLEREKSEEYIKRERDGIEEKVKEYEKLLNSNYA